MGVALDAPWDGSAFAPPTAIDIATIENAIVARLKAQIVTIEIAQYPARPESWRLTHRIGAALIKYAGAKYGAPRDTAAIIQEREMQFEISLTMRDLGWAVGGDPGGTSPGAYAIIEAIRAALTGFRVPGCRKVRPVEEKFAGRDKEGGVWKYQLIYGLSTVAVEPSVTDDYPLFLRGVAMEEGGLTTIAVGGSNYAFSASGTIQLPNGNVFAIAVTAAGGAQLREGTDYSVDNVNGIVTAIAGGAASGGETVQIAYSYAEQVVATADQTAPIG
ncbi:MAG: Gp37 family protein [Candidatus Binataceae bacterium]